MRSSVHLLSRCAFLAAIGVSSLSACNRGPDTIVEVESFGSISLALTATARSGNTYRLREAVFVVRDARTFEVVARLFSESDPDARILTETLSTGPYLVTLLDGWFMERIGGVSNPGSGGAPPSGTAGSFGFAGGPASAGAAATGQGPTGTGVVTGAPTGVMPPTATGSAIGGFSFGGEGGEGGNSSGGFDGLGGTRDAGVSGGAGGFGGGEDGGVGGGAVIVDADLLSDETQQTSIFANETSFVQYLFQVGDDVFGFGEGDLAIGIDVVEVQSCETPDDVTRPERILLENDAVATSIVGIQQVFDALASNGDVTGDGELLYRQLIDSYATADVGQEPSAVHCGDEVTNGATTLNGFPITCNRVERFQIDNFDEWFATAFVNRIDLAPTNGAHCGQQRIIFANNAQNRMFMIFESQVPNPDPESGVEGCAPLAEFWADANAIDDPVLRGLRLTDAFLFGDAELETFGFGPFMNPVNLTAGSGQIRTNQFDQSPWTLREFKLAERDGELAVVPFPVAEAPNGNLWDDTLAHPHGDACRANFLEAVDGLLTNDPARMSFVVDHECKDAESRNDFGQAYAFRMSEGFREQLEQRLDGTDLTAEQVANRAQFAGSCIGCHEEAGAADLGAGIRAPFSRGFVHVEEFSSSDCLQRNAGTTCFPTSQALRNVFLPSRLRALSDLIGMEIVEDPCEGSSGAGGMFGRGSGGSGAGGSGGVIVIGPDGPPSNTPPGPPVQIELPEADMPIDELQELDAERRAGSGTTTIIGRSARATH